MRYDGSIGIENDAPGNGLAQLLEAYLFWVLLQGKGRERELRDLNLTVGIDITDSDTSVTVRFTGERVHITNGMDERSDVAMRTTAARALSFSGVVFSGDLIGYLTEGRRNALDALSSGELEISGLVANLPRVIRLLKAVSRP
ncbi:MAG: hypothetical protein JW885_13250 [Deltaproteobacteria bacterium]|nr:hypothetical protein [Candidatus Zymogenaceae bacterium]